jgi:hypothetical protein
MVVVVELATLVGGVLVGVAAARAVITIVLAAAFGRDTSLGARSPQSGQTSANSPSGLPRRTPVSSSMASSV